MEVIRYEIVDGVLIKIVKQYEIIYGDA